MVTHPDDSSSPDKLVEPPQQFWKKLLYISFAGIFFALGVAGVALPGLPTTPFLLLTSYCLTRCSPKLNARLLRSRLFGSILRDWQRHRGVRMDVKVQAVTVVVIAVSATLFFSQLPLTVKLLISACACVGIAVVVRLPTLTSEQATRTDNSPRNPNDRQTHDRQTNDRQTEK